MKNEMYANVGNSQKVRMCVSTAGSLNPWYLSMGFRPGTWEKRKQAGKSLDEKAGSPRDKAS